jgi:hypothetical protein
MKYADIKLTLYPRRSKRDRYAHVLPKLLRYEANDDDDNNDEYSLFRFVIMLCCVVVWCGVRDK